MADGEKDETEGLRDQLKETAAEAKDAVKDIVEEVPLPVRTSDLPKRAASAVVMLVVAGTALYLGGWWWNALVALVAVGVIYEWRALVVRFSPSLVVRLIWMVAGLAYVGVGALTLALVRQEQAPADPQSGQELVLLVIGMVISVDVGAYFAGRTIGGPKIAPSISPSKTWAGLFGAAVAASIVAVLALYWSSFGEFLGASASIFGGVFLGTLTAIVAQAGDFFESWMKRRAGVKDSGNLIPGHGGLFDRTDGLLAVCVVLGVFAMLSDLA